MVRLFARREPEPKIGHKPFIPGDRRKAIAFWKSCARVWMARRFQEEAIEGWKPARIGQVIRFGGR